jgi:hypothetical protein
MQRTLENPFTESIQISLHQMGVVLPQRMTITEIRDTVVTLSVLKDNISLPDYNLMGIEALDRFYSAAINEVQNMILTHDRRPRLRSFEDTNAQYVDLKVPRFLQVNENHLVKALILLEDRLKEPAIVESERWVYVLDPSLLNNAHFDDDVRAIQTHVEHMGIKTHRELNRQARLIVSIFSPSLFQGVAKIPFGTDTHPKYNYLSLFYSWDEILVFHGLGLRENEEVEMRGIRLGNKVNAERLSRPLLVTLWLYLVSGANIRQHYSINFQNQYVELDVYIALFNYMNLFNWTPTWASNVLVLILWLTSIEGEKLSVCRCVENENVAFASFVYDNWKPVYIIAHSNNGNPHLSIWCGKNGQYKGSNLVDYAVGIAYMLNSTCMPREFRIRGVKGIRSASFYPEHFIKITLFGRKFVIREDKPDKIDVKAIFIDYPDDLIYKYINGLKNFEGSVTGPIISFPSSFGRSFVVTPWHISPEPSMLTVSIKVNKIYEAIVIDMPIVTFRDLSEKLYVLDYLYTENTVIYKQREYTLQDVRSTLVLIPRGSESYRPLGTVEDMYFTYRSKEIRYGYNIYLLHQFLYGKYSDYQPCTMKDSTWIMIKDSTPDKVAIAKMSALHSDEGVKDYSLSFIMAEDTTVDVLPLIDGIIVMSRIIVSIKQNRRSASMLDPPLGADGRYMDIKIVKNKMSVDPAGFVPVLNSKFKSVVVSFDHLETGIYRLWIRQGSNLSQKQFEDFLIYNEIGDLQFFQVDRLRGDRVKKRTKNVKELADKYINYIIVQYGEFYAGIANKIIYGFDTDIKYHTPEHLKITFSPNIKPQIMLLCLDCHPEFSKFRPYLNICNTVCTNYWLPAPTTKYCFDSVMIQTLVVRVKELQSMGVITKPDKKVLLALLAYAQQI